jgi:hypothetical protein
MFGTQKRRRRSTQRRVGIVVLELHELFNRFFVRKFFDLFVRLIVRPAVEFLQQEGWHRAGLVLHEELESSVQVQDLTVVDDGGSTGSDVSRKIVDAIVGFVVVNL